MEEHSGTEQSAAPAEAPFRSGRAYRLGLTLGGILAVLVVLAMLAFGLLQTPPGRSIVTRTVERVINVRGEVIRLGKLTGTLPFALRFDSLTLVDTAGSWLVCRDVSIHWSPPTLRRRIFHIHHLSAEKIKWQRRPEYAGTKGSGAGGFSVPRITIPPLRLDSIALDEVAIAEELTGFATRLQVSGSMRDSEAANPARAHLLIRDKDRGEVVHLEAMLSESATQHLQVHATISDPADGLVAALTNRHYSKPLTASFTGSGPLDNWEAALQGEGLGYGALDTRIRLSLDTAATLHVTGKYTPSPASFPARAGELIDSTLSFALLGSFTKKGTISIDSCTLENRIAIISGRAHIDSERHIDGEVSIALRRPRTLARLAGVSRLGNASGTVGISGPLPFPTLAGTVMLDELRQGTVLCNSLDLQINARPTGRHAQAPEYRLDSRLAVGRCSSRDTVLFEGRPSVVSLEGTITDSRMNFDNLRLSTAWATLAGSGQLDFTSGRYQTSANLRIPRPQRLPGLDSLISNGVLSAELSASGTLQKGASAKLMAFADSLAGLPDPIARLTGPRCSVTARATTHDGHAWRVDTCTFVSRNLRAHAAGIVDGSRRMLDARADIRLSDAARLLPDSMRTLSGPLRSTVALGGDFDSLLTHAVISSDSLILNDSLVLHGTQIDLTLAGPLSSATGSLQLRSRRNDTELSLRSGVRLSPQTLAMSDLSAELFSTAIDGAFSVRLDTLGLNGSVRIRSDDLSPFEEFVQNRIGGALDGTVDFFSQGTAQGAEFDFTAENAAFGRFAMKSARAGATIYRLWEKPSGLAEMEVSGARFDTMRIDSMNLVLQGNAEALDLRAWARGYLRDSIETSMAASLRREDQGLRARLITLAARYGSVPMELIEPASLYAARDTLFAEELRFRCDTGRVDARAIIGEESVLIAVALRAFPVSVFRVAGWPFEHGLIDMRFRMTGDPAQPDGRCSIFGQNLRLSSQASSSPLGVHAEAYLRDAHLTGMTAIFGLGADSLAMRYAIPLQVSAIPAKVHVDSTDSLRMELRGTVDLSLVNSILALDLHELGGQLSLHGGLNGTIGTPMLWGTGELSEGLYLNAISGTVVRDATARLRAEGTKVYLQDGRATDGEGGKLRVTAEYALDPGMHFPYDVKARSKRFAVVNTGTMVITADGGVRFKGNNTGADLTGWLTTGPSEYFLVNQTSPEMTELNVVEINQSEGAELSGRTASPQPWPLKYDLAVNVPWRFFVRGMGLDTEWRGRLEVSGMADAPVIEGTLKVSRGRFDFLQRRFGLSEGIITLNGAVPPQPWLEITANDTLPAREVRLKLSGPASAPSFSLTSTPPAPTDQILAEMLFNRDMANITPVQAFRLWQMWESLKPYTGSGSGSVLGFLDQTRRVLTIDQIDLQEEQVRDSSRTTLTVGKYLSDNVFVEGRKGLYEGSPGKLGLKWEVSPRIAVEGDVGSDDRRRIGITWKRDY
jgi:translocation and assembly module TamB